VIALYIVLMAFQNLIVAIIVPSLTAGAISGERERQTLDLMLLTKMSTTNIVIGKLLSSLLTILLIIVASLPVFSIVFYYGGISPLNVFGMTAYTLLFAAMTGSISIFFSTITKKTIVSTVWTYIILLAITLGNLVFTMIGIFMFENMRSTGLDTIFAYFSFSTNPGAAFLSLVDTLSNAGFFNGMFENMSYGYYGYPSSGVIGFILDILYHIPIWVLNCVFMSGVTAFAVFISSRLIKPVKGGK